VDVCPSATSEDLNRLITHPEKLRNDSFAKRKAPASRKKAPTGLHQVSKTKGLQFFAKNNAPAASKKTPQGYHSQMAMNF
jgi:hypothetical protein